MGENCEHKRVTQYGIGFDKPHLECDDCGRGFNIFDLLGALVFYAKMENHEVRIVTGANLGGQYYLATEDKGDRARKALGWDDK